MSGKSRAAVVPIAGNPLVKHLVHCAGPLRNVYARIVFGVGRCCGRQGKSSNRGWYRYAKVVRKIGKLFADVSDICASHCIASHGVVIDARIE